MNLARGLAVLMVFAPGALAGPLTVGFGASDITPGLGGKPVFLAGFGHNRKATEIHTRLAARAVVLADGESKVAIVSADVVGLFLPDVQKVRGRLPGFTHVIVTATHNHHGPDTMGLWGTNPFVSGVDVEYMRLLLDRLVEAVQSAERSAVAATAVIGSVDLPELLVDTRDPQIKHETLVAIQFRDARTRTPVGVVVQWNCHPETLASGSSRLSADYVAATCEKLTERYKCPTVYLTGTVGGLMTSMRVPVRSAAGEPLPEGSVEKTERFGVLVGEAAIRALERPENVELTPIESRTRSILLPVDNPVYKLAKQFRVLDREMEPWAGNPDAPRLVTEKIEGRPAIRSEIGYLRLGELDVAVIPGEIYPELVLDKVPDPAPAGADFPDAAREPAIYGGLSGRFKILIGLGNDEIGYIIPKRQWDEKPPFTYGRTKPPYGEINSLGPDTAPIICEAFRQLARPKNRTRSGT